MTMKKTTAKAASPINYLDEVRTMLLSVPKSDYQRISVEAGLSWRTIYSVMDEGHDPRYSTVDRLYRVLLESPPQDRRKTR